MATPDPNSGGPQTVATDSSPFDQDVTIRPMNLPRHDEQASLGATEPDHCDVLGVSASSFSLVPAMLNDRCQRFFRPDARAGRLVSFDPWNTTVYADRVEEERMSSLTGRVRYRWDNIRRMGEAHGYATLLRRSIPRLHRRVSYELGAVLVSWFIQSMRLLNRLLRRRFGRTLSPLDVFSTDWLIGFFTRKFNR